MMRFFRRRRWARDIDGLALFIVAIIILFVAVWLATSQH